MLEEQIKTSNEENIVRNIDIAKQYSKVIHILVISSKILIIISGLLSFASTKFDYWIEPGPKFWVEYIYVAISR